MPARKKRDPFDGALELAVEAAIRKLPSRIGGETLYAVSLYTSGESEISYCVFSANTEEALTRRAEEYAARDPSYAGEAGRRRLRWSTCDWGYHDIDERVGAIEIPRASDRVIYGALLDALRIRDRAGAFGTGEARERVTLLVTCGDMSEEFFRRGLRHLNPPSVVYAYLAEYTPDALIAEIDALEAWERARTWLALYEDLALDESSRSGELRSRADACSLTEFDAGEQLERLPNVVPGLLEIIERHGFGPPFNEKGTVEYEQRGAFTPSSQLATSTVFLIANMKWIDEAAIARLQQLLSRRVELDRSLERTDTLAENIARVLHTLRPTRFPRSKLDERTNHLRNPEAFLPTSA